MHVKVVAGETAESNDVCLANCAAVGQQRVADLQIFKIAAERVNFGFAHSAATDIFAGDGCQHGRRTLHCGTLQIVLHGAYAAKFFAAAGAARTAMLQHRQRRAMAGRFDRRLAIENVQPAMMHGCHRHRLGRRRRIARHQCRHQAAAPLAASASASSIPS